MDTESVGVNLSRGQFGVAYFRDHHSNLGLQAPQPGAILGLEPDPESRVQPTGKRTRLLPTDALIPNQTHVHLDKVDHYVKHPSNDPIAVVKNPETGQIHVLDGHHRLVANRIRGVRTRAEYWGFK